MRTVLFLMLSATALAQPRYSPFPESSLKKCTLYRAPSSELQICLTGRATAADLERAQKWAARATLTWFRALVVMDRSVTARIRFACENPDLSIRLKPGSGTSFASPGVANIYLSRPYGTWTHELGHALAGLGDTYKGGSAGSCGSQPQSLMCWGAYGPRANPDRFSTLWSDDVAGIQANYRKLYPKAVAPEWAATVDLEKPLDLEKPWPTGKLLAPGPAKHQVKKAWGGPTPIDYSPNTKSVDL